jgi:hypothetical protein
VFYCSMLEFCGIVIGSSKVDSRDGMHIHIHLDRGRLTSAKMGGGLFNRSIDTRRFWHGFEFVKCVVLYLIVDSQGHSFVNIFCSSFGILSVFSL